MSENYNENFETQDPISEESEKKELLEEVKILAESEDSQALNKVREIQKKWKRLGSWDSVYDTELQEEFDTYLDKIFARRNEIQKAVADKKKELIAKAQELLNAENMNQAGKQADALMEEWKAAGSAARDEDEKLWEQFSAARKAFFEKKKAKRIEQMEQYEAVNEKKKELIEKARVIVTEPENWNQATAALSAVMEEWKAAGSAGPKYESGLWDEFSALRSGFFSARSEFYKDIRKEQSRKYEAKKALIERAKANLDSHDFSREAVDEMKSLSKEWKEIGYCGKDKDDAIWTEFRKVMDAYFDEVGKNREKKHADWVDHMEDVKDRKKEAISSAQKQIRRMENEMNGLISQARTEELEDMIAEKERYIQDLRDDIADIDRKIEK